jgi:putative transposase
VWDNLNTHTNAVMRAFIDAHAGLTVIQLPAYAPELNPTEGIWSAIKGCIAATGLDLSPKPALT